MSKKLTLLVVALLIAGGMVMGAGKAEPAKGKAPEKADIKIIWWGSQTRHEGTIKVIDLYKQKNPNLGITYEFSN